MAWKQAMASRGDASSSPGAAGDAAASSKASRASVDAAAERTVVRLQAVVDGSRGRVAPGADGPAVGRRSCCSGWCRWLYCGCSCGCCPRWCCSWCRRATPGPATSATSTGGSAAGGPPEGSTELRIRCVAADEEFARKLVLRSAPQSLADLAVMLVAKLRPGGEAAAMLMSGPAEQRKGGLASRLVGTSPAEALRLLGVVRIVSQQDSVELVDDSDAADVRTGDTLTVHWASPDAPPAAGEAGGASEGSMGGIEAAARAGSPAGANQLRRRAKQSRA